MRPTRLAALVAAAVLAAPVSTARAQSVTGAAFVNGLAIPGGSLDRSAGSDADRRVGFFSDLYYDRGRNEWWGLSDRGPGGGLLSYETRVQRFTLGVDGTTGRVSDFRILETVKLRAGGVPLNGLAPAPGPLGNAFDPEGFVLNPLNGRLLVSDEYGPSLYEFERDGTLVRRFETPANLVPRDGAGNPNFGSDLGNVAGKRTNRGFEGLAVSPDGRHAYAVLQSAMLDEGAGDGRFARIVQYDVATGRAVAQYAYQLDRSGQGQGISALVALGDDRFLVLERNNRGIGVGATLAAADKSVYEITLAGATDVSTVTLGATALPPGAAAVTKVAKVLDLDANTLAELGGRSPEKWEGLAIGPQLAGGRYLLLAGTDNDYSVTQSGAGEQFDAYFRFAEADPFATSILCPIGRTVGCFAQGDPTAARTLTADHVLLPGVLHAYTAEVRGYVAPAVVPEPGTLALAGAGLLLLGGLARRRPRA